MTQTIATILVVALAGCHPNNPSPVPPTPTVPPPAQAEPQRNDRPAMQSNAGNGGAETSASLRSGSGVNLPASDQVVAKVGGQPITLQQLQRPLVEGYGLNVLLNLVQLELAKQWATKAGVTVSPEDVTAEFNTTLAKMFQDAEKADYPRLLDQLLEQKRISRPEFDMVIETNAYLRKIAEPQLKGKISDDNLQEAFRTLYGENIQVRHIQVPTAQDIVTVKQRLAAGEKFPDVARAMSQNARTAPLGGELPPFSRSSPAYPQAFKDAAFALKHEGDVSDPVQIEGAYHLIQLVRLIPPKAVKFEDVKDSLREDLQDRMMQATVQALRADLQKQTRAGAMVILDPTLKKQYEDRITEANKQITDREQISKEQQLERKRLEVQRKIQSAATQSSSPSMAPAPGAAQPPVNLTAPATEGLRPPATGSAAAPSNPPAAVDQNTSPASPSATSPTTRP